MTSYCRSFCKALLFFVVCYPSFETVAAELKKDRFVPLFDGKSFEGWKNVNGAPSTWTMRDGMVHCSGKPTGVLRTTRMYQNFILEAEWRHLQPKGNSGIFVWADALTAPGQPYHRGVEVQVLDGREASWYTSHGDIFPIHGATWKPENGREEDKLRAYPTEMRCKPSPEWNHYRIECVDGSIRLAVNGKVVTRGSQCNLRKGYICLESEGSPTDFRNIRIKELPSGPLEPDQVAKSDEGFSSLYTGVDFSGWQTLEGSVKDRKVRGWKVNDWQLHCDGTTAGDDRNLWSEKSYENFELIVDWRWNRQSEADNTAEEEEAGGDKAATEDAVVDAGILLRGGPKCQIRISPSPSGSGGISDGSSQGDGETVPLLKADKPPGEWNRFRITLVDETITVVLNDKTVTDNFHLSGISSEGKIALQHCGHPIEFANLFIKPLP